MKSKTEGSRDEAFLQPWFLPHEKAAAILRLLPTGYRDNMRHYFEDYGCMRCDRKNVQYDCNGLCARCKNKIKRRLGFSARRHLKTPAPTDREPLDVFYGKIRSARRLLSDIAR